MAASATGQRAQQTQLEVGSQPRNPRARVAVTDQAMGWEQREGPRGQREGPRGSRKGPEFSRFVSCGLDSPALVTQPRVPAVFLRGLQRPLGNPGADTCGPPGAASLLPALAESRQAREATDGRAARVAHGARQHFAWTAGAAVTGGEGGRTALWGSRKTRLCFHAALERAIKSR